MRLGPAWDAVCAIVAFNPISEIMKEGFMDKSSELPANDPHSRSLRKSVIAFASPSSAFANDNISPFIEPGELDRLLEEVQLR